MVIQSKYVKNLRKFLIPILSFPSLLCVYGLVANPGVLVKIRIRNLVKIICKFLSGRLRPVTGLKIVIRSNPVCIASDPDTGKIHPDLVDFHPDSGKLHQDAGKLHSDTGQLHPDTGELHPDPGKIHPDPGKIHKDPGNL